MTIKEVIWCFLCIWCNRICWHALMFKILYIIVGPLCPASLKPVVFYQVPPSDKHSLIWLANWHSALWLAEHHKPRQKCNAPFHNRKLPKWKTINNALSFTCSSSREGKRVAWQTQWWCLYVFANKPWLRKLTPLWCDHLYLSPPLSLSFSLTHTQTRTHTHVHTHKPRLRLLMCCDVTLSLSLSLSHTHARAHRHTHTHTHTHDMQKNNDRCG